MSMRVTKFENERQVTVGERHMSPTTPYMHTPVLCVSKYGIYATTVYMIV